MGFSCELWNVNNDIEIIDVCKQANMGFDTSNYIADIYKKKKVDQELSLKELQLCWSILMFDRCLLSAKVTVRTKVPTIVLM